MKMKDIIEIITRRLDIGYNKFIGAKKTIKKSGFYFRSIVVLKHILKLLIKY